MDARNALQCELLEKEDSGGDSEGLHAVLSMLRGGRSTHDEYPLSFIDKYDSMGMSDLYRTIIHRLENPQDYVQVHVFGQDRVAWDIVTEPSKVWLALHILKNQWAWTVVRFIERIK